MFDEMRQAAARHELRTAWVAAAIVTAVAFGWVLAGDFTLTGFPASSYLAALALAAGGLMPAVRLRPRLAAFFGGLGFLLFAWPGLRLFNHLMMTLPYPLADEWLAGLDAALGLTWFSYVSWVDGQAWLVRLMDLSYESLTPVSVVFAMAVLVAFGSERMYEFIRLFVATAILCTVIGAAFPADAAMVFYGVRPEMLTNVPVDAGTYHIAFLEALRGEGTHNFHMPVLPGLTTFPSFHTAMGIVIIHCCRGRHIVSYAAAAYGAVMIAATPVFGSHYFIDLIAGTAVAVAAIAWLRLAARRGVSIPAPASAHSSVRR